MKKDKKNLINKKYLLTSAFVILAMQGQYAFSSKAVINPENTNLPVGQLEVLPLKGEPYTRLLKLKQGYLELLQIPNYANLENAKKWISVTASNFVMSDIEKVKEYAKSKGIFFNNDHEIILAQKARRSLTEAIEYFKKIQPSQTEENIRNTIRVNLSKLSAIEKKKLLDLDASLTKFFESLGKTKKKPTDNGAESHDHADGGAETGTP